MGTGRSHWKSRKYTAFTEPGKGLFQWRAMPLGHAERHLQGRHKDTGNDKGFKREIVLQGYPKDTPRIP